MNTKWKTIWQDSKPKIGIVLGSLSSLLSSIGGFFIGEQGKLILGVWLLGGAFVLIAIAGLISLKSTEKVSVLSKNINEKDKEVLHLKHNIDQLYLLSSNKDREFEAKQLDNQKKISQLNTELEEAYNSQLDLFYKSVDQHLGILASSIQFNSDERITLYVRSEGNIMQLIGRYSETFDYTGLAGRKWLATYGFIGQALRKGEFFVNDLPDYECNNGKDYIEAVNKLCLLPEDILLGMRMKSRSYYAKSFGKENFDYNIAVIIFESLHAGKFEANHMRAMFLKEAKLLVPFIKFYTQTLQPDKNYSYERKF